MNGKIQKCMESSLRVGGGDNNELPHLKNKHGRIVGRPATCDAIVGNIVVNTEEEMFT